MLITRRKLLQGSGLVAATAMLGTVARAQTTPSVYAENGIAIDGTDPVAYFTQGAPVAGKPDLAQEWNGAVWQFSNVANRDAFAADPAAYAPQYGGYCAYAVSEGYTAPTVPEAWRIVDGKLYLNFSKRIQRLWERDIPGRIAAADANWPSVLA